MDPVKRQRMKLTAPLSAVAYGCYGLVLLAAGAHASWTRPDVDYFTLAIGAAFLVMGAVAWKTGCSCCRR